MFCKLNKEPKVKEGFSPSNNPEGRRISEP